MLAVPAYAKVNLCLDVVGRRADGWHDIASVICTIDWHDLAAVELCRNAGRAPAVRLSGPFAAGVPAGPDNLAARAGAELLAAVERGAATGRPAPEHGGTAARPAATGHRSATLDVWIDKQLPAAAGLAGGSADAAAVLRAGATLLGLDPATLPPIATRLGSDVPAVLAGGTLLAAGRGEQLRRLPTPRLHLAVAVAGASVTAQAYAALTDEERRPTGRADRLAAALMQTATIPPDLLGSALEPAACRAAPGLAGALQRLRASTPDTPWHLTGSGGAAFALAPSAAAAGRLAEAARAAGFPARACRTVAAPLGPLPA